MFNYFLYGQYVEYQQKNNIRYFKNGTIDLTVVFSKGKKPINKMKYIYLVTVKQTHR